MSDWTEAKKNSDLSDEWFGEIKNLYKRTIKLPLAKFAGRFLLCPVGLVGAGKTTVIKPLSEKLRLVRVSTDEVRKILKEKGFNYDRAKDLALAIIEELLDDGYSVAIDANCGSEDAIDKIRELGVKYKAEIIWIHVNPPVDFITNKLIKYKHTWLFKDSDKAIQSFLKYKRKYGDFSNLLLPYAYVFDTSRVDLNDQIEESIEIIAKKFRK